MSKNNTIQTKEKKSSGQNWGKPRTWEQKLGSRRLRKRAKAAIRKELARSTEKN